MNRFIKGFFRKPKREVNEDEDEFEDLKDLMKRTINQQRAGKSQCLEGDVFLPVKNVKTDTLPKMPQPVGNKVDKTVQKNEGSK